MRSLEVFREQCVGEMVALVDDDEELALGPQEERRAEGLEKQCGRPANSEMDVFRFSLMDAHGFALSMPERSSLSTSNEDSAPVGCFPIQVPPKSSSKPLLCEWS